MKVLFVGNSHTYVNDMPQIFKMNADKEVDVFMIARGGITFETHLKDPSLYFALKQDYDVVVFQQAAHVPCPSKEETLRDGKALIELARKHGKKAYVLKPWPRLGDDEGFEVIRDIYTSLKEETDIEIIEAGEAIVKVNKEYSCYRGDNEHMNPLGSYVEACTILHTLFHQSSFKGITLDMDHEVPFEAKTIPQIQKELIEKIINEGDIYA